MTDETTLPDILDRIKDLHLQATTERSHYYTAKVLEDSAKEISLLRAALLRILAIEPEQWWKQGIYQAQKIARLGLGKVE